MQRLRRVRVIQEGNTRTNEGQSASAPAACSGDHGDGVGAGNSEGPGSRGPGSLFQQFQFGFSDPNTSMTVEFTGPDPFGGNGTDQITGIDGVYLLSDGSNNGKNS